MVNNNNNMKENLANEYNSQTCNYKHKLVDQKFEIVKENIKEIKKDIEKTSEEMKKEEQESKDKISVFKEGVNTKLDEFDKAFRGDGRIGVFEQLRTLKTEIGGLNEGINGIKDRLEKVYKNIKKILLIILFLFIFLIGGRVIGLNVQNVRNFIKEIFGKKVKIEQIEKNVGKIDENIEIIIEGYKKTNNV